MRRDVPGALERVSERLPAIVIETLRAQWTRVAALDAEVDAIEGRLAVWHRQSAASRQLRHARPSSSSTRSSRYTCDQHAFRSSSPCGRIYA